MGEVEFPMPFQLNLIMIQFEPTRRTQAAG
jgi:hypothetical protein